MKKIAVLDQNTIDKIAAGEVVERPASVVKELVENAVDAGSTAITVEIKDGGISFIRVTDNGGGIPKEQVPLAFLRHATSKIQRVEDLLWISSLGFRGEALSSISAVSQMEVITKTPEALTGVRYIIEGGQEKALEEIGAPNGTTMLVRNLFYNTPARGKFLKTAMTEAGYVSSYIEQLALSHQNISFKYMVNGQTRLHTSGNANLKDVIYGIYGRDITRELLPVSIERPGIFISGFIGKPVVARGNRNFENYYINGRYVKSKLLMKAIEEAYKPFMMQHKYPFVCLHYTIEGEAIDVNVHPTKMEVRFQNQGAVYNATYDMIQEALSGRELIPQVELEKKQAKPVQQKLSAPEPFETGFKQQTVRQQPAAPSYLKEEPAAYVPEVAKAPEMSQISRQVGIRPAVHVEVKETQQEKPKEEPKNTVEHTVVQQPKQMELFDDKLLSKEARSRHRIIGQLFDTYWLVEYENTFYIIDQHAAHEKVLFEKTVNSLKSREYTSQMVNPPIILTFSRQEELLFKKHQDYFAGMGFEIEHFGGKEYAVRAVPGNLFSIAKKELLMEMIDGLSEDTSSHNPDLIFEKIASMSCKAAVKGNNRLSPQEANELIDQLLDLENPYACPHGRPTIISMSKYELEKKFKRII